MLCVLLSVFLTLASLSFQTHAVNLDSDSSGYNSDDYQHFESEMFYYEVSSDGYANIEMFKTEGFEEIIIPERIDGYLVTGVGSPSFGGSFPDDIPIRKIVIPKSVREIGDAFSLLNRLEEIVVDEQNQYYSSVDGVLFNKTKTSLECYPCGKQNDSYIIPNSVTYVSGFKNCHYLMEILVSEGNESFISDNGVLFNKEKTELICYPPEKESKEYIIPPTVTSLRFGAFNNCSKLESVEISKGIDCLFKTFKGCQKLKSIVIPESISAIGYETFRDCISLQEIVIPDSVREIENSAFSNCSSLKSITLGSNITYLGSHAFYGCTNLETIMLPDGITEINEYTFSNCYSLKDVVLSEQTTRIGWSAFSNCSSLQTLALPDTIEEIERSAFRNCNLQEIILPPRLREVSDYTFSDNKTVQLTFNQGLVSIGGFAFQNGDFEKICIPDSVQSIGMYAFSNCNKLEVLTLGSSLNEIGDSAFRFCYKLTNIVIPDSVVRIGDRAFASNSNLKNFTIGKSVSELGDNFIDSWGALENIFVNSENENYFDVNGILFDSNTKELLIYPSNNKTNILNILEGVTSISNINSSYLEEINIPSTVTSIGNINASNLENINVSQDNPAFFSIDGILFSKETNELLIYPAKNKTKELTIPKGIVKTCAVNSNYLKTLNVPSTVAELGNINCDALENINVSEDNQIYCSFDGILYDKAVTKMLHLPLSTHIEEWIVPETVESITSSFATKYLKNIYLNENCTQVNGTYMGGVDPEYESALENIFVAENNSKYYSQKGVLIEKGSYSIIGTQQDMITLYPPKNKNKTFRFPNNTQIIQLSQRNLEYLEEVFIPASATMMSWQSFSWCQNLKKIYVDKDNPVYCDIDGVLYNKDKTELLKYPSGKTNEFFVVPNSVEIISGTVFRSNQNLKSIQFSENMKEVGGCFWYCYNLKEFIFPKNTKQIRRSIGYQWEGDMGHGNSSNIPLDGVTIKGYTNTVAETYAKENGFTFVSLGTVNKLGDVNGDDKVDITDATTVQKYLAELIDLDENQKIAADTNGDGIISITDATEIQKFVAEIPSNIPKS